MFMKENPDRKEKISMLPVDPPRKYEVDVFKGELHGNIGGEMSNIGNEGASSKLQNGKFKIFRFNNFW